MTDYFLVQILQIEEIESNLIQIKSENLDLFWTPAMLYQLLIGN